MTIALSFNATLWRVEITGSALADGYVRVERSVNELIWETVRGAVALEVVAGAISVFDYDGYAPGKANFYRIVPAVDETFDTPAADQNFGDPYEVPAGVREIQFEAWGAGGSGQGNLPPDLQFARPGGGGGAYARSSLTVTPGETLLVRPGQGGRRDGSGFAGQNGNSSAVIRDGALILDADGGIGTVGFSTPGTGGLATFPDSIGDVTFAGGAGGAREGSSTGHAGGGGGGSATAAAAGSVGGAGTLGVGGAGGAGEGAGGDGGDAAAAGSDGLFPGGGGGGQGAFGAGFPAASGNGAHGRVTAHSWPTGTPESDSIVVTGHDVIVLKSIRYPVVNRAVVVTEFTDPERASRDGVFEVSGRSLPVTVHELRGSQAFTLELQTQTGEQARDMDLILALGGELFLHVPPNCPVPGGYVTIGNTGQARRLRSARSARRYFSLPCRVTAKPGPDIIPTTLVWQTVYNAYGSWEALWAAHSSWFSLYQTVGSLDDAVVL